MNSHTIFANLRDILATLYPQEDSARRVATDVGLDLRHITFSAHAINNWHAILNETKKTSRIAALFDITLSEYGASQELRNAYNAYLNLIEQSNRIDPVSHTLAGDEAKVADHQETAHKAQVNAEEAKHQHSPMPDEERPMFPSVINAAMRILRKAIIAVPAVKDALGVAGIAAAVAIVLALLRDPLIALLGIVVMFLLMAVLVVFANLAGQGPKLLRLPMIVLVWSSLLLMVATAILLFTTTFFRWPVPLLAILSPQPVLYVKNPLVYLMDSTLPQMVYTEKNRSIGKTNTDDIRDILDPLLIPAKQEKIHEEWDREEQVLQEDPDLIIIHNSAFYTATTVTDPQKRLGVFLDHMKMSKTKFLIYSRADDFRDEEGTKQVFEQLHPSLKGRLDVLWVKDGDWRNPETRTKLQKKVKSLLGLLPDEASDN